MKLSFVPALLALLGFLSLHLTPLHAADAAKPRGIPSHGKLQAVDTTAQTITLESKKDANGRVFYLATDTKITDGAGNPTTLASATVGEDVGVYYTKDATGKQTLVTLRLGAKTGAKTSTKPSTTTTAPAATPSATPTPPPMTATPAPAATTPAPAATSTAAATTTKPKKQTMTGKVTTIDATANTLAVHGRSDQTFNIASTTKITGATGLSAITVGAKVTVSYTTAADGSVSVTAVKVAK